jgi:HK97 family phage portal protein
LLLQCIWRNIVRLPWNAREISRSVPHSVTHRSIQDPALAEYLNSGGWNDSGETVTERSALAFTAFWRGVQIIAGTIAGLPLKTYSDGGGERTEVASIFDDPCPAYFTRFEWVQFVMVHLCVHGNAYLLHQYNEAGALASLFPLHPSMVHVKNEPGVGRVFTVNIPGEDWGQNLELTEDDITQVMGMSLDGLTGLSPISICRNSLGAGLAADKAAARMFSSGLMIGGLVTSDENLEEDDARAVVAGLKSKMGGVNNAGDLAFVNASLKISPWSMTSEDAQFLESRVHQVEEVARILGIPPHLLGQTEKQTSWGTGVAEQNRGLARYTLRNYTTPFEQRCSKLLSNPRFVEFEYAGLLQAAPEVEIPLLIAQVQAGLLTMDEARAIRNLPPLEPTETPSPDGPTEEVL